MRRANERRAEKAERRTGLRAGGLAVGAGVALGSTVIYAPPATAAAVEVTTLADSGEGSLRAAVAAATATDGHDVITFAPEVTGTIELTSGQISGDGDVTIDGPGADLLTIDAGGESRIFRLTSDFYDATGVVISGLTLTGGNADGYYDQGGAVYVNAPSITLDGLVVTSSRAMSSGGGFSTERAGAVVITGSTFADNESGRFGGGVYVDDAASFTMTDSVVSGNEAERGGGGVLLYRLYGEAGGHVADTLIADNTTAGDGGGLGLFTGDNGYEVVFPTDVENTTITGNHAGGQGGGVAIGEQYGEVAQTFTSVTIAENTSNRSGGIAARDGDVLLRNTVVADNTRRDLRRIDSSDPFLLDFSLVEDPAAAPTSQITAGASLLGIDPRLGELRDNGGTTLTMAPVVSSPVVDSGSSFGLGADQRGDLRPIDRVAAAGSGDGADMGAVELRVDEEPPAHPNPVPDPAPDEPIVVTTTADDGAGSLRAAVSQAGENEGHDVITFAPEVSGTIQLTSGAIEGGAGLTIQGPGADVLAVDAGGTARALELTAAYYSDDRDVTISGLTFTGGGGNSDAYYSSNGGAAYLEAEAVVLDDVVATGNHATRDGGGFAVSGSTVVVRDSRFSDNETSGFGGGLAVRRATELTITGTVFTDNHADEGAGGLGVRRVSGEAPAVISGSLIAGNTTAGDGGGVALDPDSSRGVDFSTTFQNVTIAGNEADGRGGGVFIRDQYTYYDDTELVQTFTSTTIARNVAAVGGGVAAGDGAKVLQNSIVADNTDRDLRLVGSHDPFTVDHTLVERRGTTPIEEAAAGANILGQDPQLGALGDNGGPLLTMAPVATSPVIDRGAAFGLDEDQRGEPRPVDRVPGPADGDGADMGAVELRADESPTADPDPVPDPGPEQGTVVTTTADAGLGSLRAAVEAAVEAGSGVVTFAPSVTGTIELTSGAIVLQDPGEVTIEGPGADVLTVDAGGASRVLEVRSVGYYASAGSAVVVSGLTLTGGEARTLYYDGDPEDPESWREAPGGAVYAESGSLTLSHVVVTDSHGSRGGAIAAARADLTIADTQITGSTASQEGGAVAVSRGGEVAVVDSLIASNQAGSYGGGIAISRAGTFLLDGTTVADNTAHDGGGGIRLERLEGRDGHDGPEAVVRDSTISGNSTAGLGGGLAVMRDLYYDERLPVGFSTEVERSTVTGNHADVTGGGVFLGTSDLPYYGGDGVATLTSATVAGNTAPSVGGIAAEDGEKVLRNSVVADNTNGDLGLRSSNDPFTLDFSLVEDAGTTPLDQPAPGSNLLGVDPLLEALADNGGPTRTSAPSGASPVIDAGKSYGATVDQRGLARPYDADARADASDGADMGAVELHGDDFASVPDAPQLDRAAAGDKRVTLAWTPGDDGGSPVTAYAVEYRVAGTATWTAAETLAATARGASVTGLQNGTSYAFRLRAINAVGTSEPSASLTATPTAPRTPPPPPPTPLPTLPKPKLSGTPKAGKKLTAVFRLPASVTGARVAYAWTYTPATKGRKPQVVGKAAALKLKKSWKGGRITLVVTVSKPGVPSKKVSVTAKIR